MRSGRITLFLVCAVTVALLLATGSSARSHEIKTLGDALARDGHKLPRIGEDHKVKFGGSREELGLSKDGNEHQRRFFPFLGHSETRRMRRAEHQAAVHHSGNSSDTAPKANGRGSWANAFRKAKHLVSQMTLDEKLKLTAGINNPKCTGATGAIKRLGIPSFCIGDGPQGVRQARGVSQFPAELTAGATWDRELVANRGAALGKEYRDAGLIYMFGPVAGSPRGRTPFGGRNWEGFGSDEYLTGEMSYASIKASQKSGVVACAKHFIGYEQESERNMRTIFGSFQQPYSANIDDKTLHQIYMWPFAESVRAGTGMVMCSYNKVNGTHACENSESLNGHLKGELNFQGVVVSDYGAVYSGAGSANGGMDMLMPGDGMYGVLPNMFGSGGSKLKEAVYKGELSEERVDDMVLRILTPVLQYAPDLKDYKGPQYSSNPGEGKDVQGDHWKVIREVGTESITMVKNKFEDGRGLPLNSNKLQHKKIAVVGEDAYPASDGYALCDPMGDCINPDIGTRTIGSGSGYAIPPYVIDPLHAIKWYLKGKNVEVKSAKANPTLPFHSISQGVDAAKGAEAALVFASASASEGLDRRGDLALDNKADELVERVAGVNNNTIVVLHVPGPVVVDKWIDHPNVTAVLFAYYPGQETGAALTPVLFGDVAPSGRLPFVVGKKVSDWPSTTYVTFTEKNPQLNFWDKLLLDWKWFDTKGIEPRFPFGYGLSYTTFKYHDFSVWKQHRKDTKSLQSTNEHVREDNLGGNSLYDVVLNAQVKVTNTGNRDGKEVAQLYVKFPSSAHEEANHVLRGFEKRYIKQGESATINFNIRRKDIAIWNTVAQKWEVPHGTFTFFCGASSHHWDKAQQFSIKI